MLSDDQATQPMQPPVLRAVAYLSKEALRHNVSVMQRHASGAQIIAMVKANGYGHGIRSVAKRLSDRVFALGVASSGEALALRSSGVQAKIILMEGVLRAEDLYAVSSKGLDLVVHDTTQLAWLAAHDLPVADVWVKVDIGMGRLGFFPEQVQDVLTQLKRLDVIRGEIRLMGHLSHADTPDHPNNLKQLDLFSKVVKRFKLPASVCNSAAICAFPDHHYEFVRPGISLYGSAPYGKNPSNFSELKPVMTVKSRLISIKE